MLYCAVQYLLCLKQWIHNALRNYQTARIMHHNVSDPLPSRVKLALSVSAHTWSSSLLRCGCLPVWGNRVLRWGEKRAEGPWRAPPPSSSQLMWFYFSLQSKNTAADPLLESLFPDSVSLIGLKEVFKFALLWGDLSPCFIYQLHFPSNRCWTQGQRWIGMAPQQQSGIWTCVCGCKSTFLPPHSLSPSIPSFRPSFPWLYSVAEGSPALRSCRIH